MQRAYSVIAPVGRAKSNWEVFSLLAAAMNIAQPFFRQSPDELIDAILAKPSAWLASTRLEALQAGQPVELPLTDGYKTDFKTASGKIEILNPREEEPCPGI